MLHVVACLVGCAQTEGLRSIGTGDAASSQSADSAQVALAPPQRVAECMARGWHPLELTVSGLRRKALWKAPAGAWPRGAILVLHGGGGRHDQWCASRGPALAAQVRFSELAVAQGHAVFLLDSTDRLTDAQGRLCGKAWDDSPLDRPNLDLPFIGALLETALPALRPAGSRAEVFITGLSSGGYMTLRAATHFGARFAAFAPVSSGDPYGWHRVCDPALSPRTVVLGVGVDNETGLPISRPGACSATAHPNEQPWDDAGPGRKPPFRMFRHLQDGINDRSCAEKAGRLLRQHGHVGPPDLVLDGGWRSLAHHLWQDAYNQPVLDFFAESLNTRSAPGSAAVQSVAPLPASAASGPR